MPTIPTAVLDSDSRRRKATRDALVRAGLKVSRARTVDELENERWVIVASGGSAPSSVARAVRAKVPDALVFAGLAKGTIARWADAVLPIPVSVRDLRVRIPELLAVHRQPDLMAAQIAAVEPILDPISLFYTFSHFKEMVYVELKRARRYGFPIALGLVALDPAAPQQPPEVRRQVLTTLALAIRRALRDTDFPVQYSQERVLLLMPHTDLAGSLIVARRICDRIAGATLRFGDEMITATASIGVAANDAGGESSLSEMIVRARNGLETAQEFGGNRVEFLDESTGPRRGQTPPLPPPRVEPLPPPSADLPKAASSP